MKEVKVKRHELLKTLVTNRDCHAVEYTEAMMGYRRAVEKILKTTLEAWARGHNPDLYKARALTEPVSHQQEYETVIQMMEMAVDSVVVLDFKDFQQYVMDEWEWTDSFKLSSSTYKR